MKHIRNFSIIAHIDHGKSTLADRFIQYCGGLDMREMSSQVLDSMDIEKERGITIKAQTAALHYKARDGQTYQLNLIDTPGHVDFSYEVSRSLSACEGALLVVDASQGVEAQTVANCYTAIDLGVEVVPVLNKIDLPAAEPERVAQEIEDIIGIDAVDAVTCSAKSGIGIEDVLEDVVKKIPPPVGDADAPLKALIVDSWFDNYVGVVMLIRVVDGVLKLKDKVKFMSTKSETLVEQLGVFTPKSVQKQQLSAGEVGFLITGIKELQAAKVGDTVTLAAKPAETPLPGFKEVQSQVFAGLYPVESHDYDALRDALEKLQLNDASLKFEPEVSQALGFGFRCGFLGLLHLEIVQERLEREFDMDLITTAPTVIYEVLMKDGSKIEVENPSKLPDIGTIETIFEPIITATILVPQEYVGSVMTLCNVKRGIQKNMQYMGRQVMLTYDLPMNEVVMDFFDKLKSTSRGYASLDYEFKEFQAADLIKLDIMVNGEKVDALSLIVHRSNAVYRGRELASKMRELIPRQMFDIAVQASIGSQIIARETVKALRKNVLAKCYGGDISRKKKLLEKQKAGKRRMKQVGNVEIPQSAFLAILQVGDKEFMSENLLYMAIAAFVIGVVLFAISSKQRQDTGEWSNTLQWGYLLMMVGVFGVLAKYLSFTAVLLIFVLITGMIWGVSKMVRSKAKQDLAGRKLPEDKEARKILQQDAYEKRVGHFVDYMSGFFPIILIVFVLRTFIAEPFQIPSSSMRPGLVVGDFILVNKFNYGIRMPISNQVVIPVNKVDHGDVVVFAFPENESVSFIKRIVGLPGDTVEYRNKELTIRISC